MSGIKTKSKEVRKFHSSVSDNGDRYSV